MRIRGLRGIWAFPSDVESSTLPSLRYPRKYLHPSPLATNSSVSFEQDALNGIGEDEDTSRGKNHVAFTPRKYDCNPRSETLADTDSSISSSSSHDGHWREEDKVLPMKKRRLVQLNLKSREPSNTTTERELRNSTETRAKRKRTEKIWTDYVLQVKWVAEKACPKIRNSSARCNRQNGKGWRCSLPAVAGHTVCEHHLAEQRKKNRKRMEEKSKAIPARKYYCALSSDSEDS